MSANNVPGLGAAVIENGQLVWSEGFGKADLENSVSATEHTLFRLGSVSKPLTATATMQLWERGKLDLDSPVQKYCPSFLQKPWPITIRELLGHLDGIRHYRPGATQDDPEIGNVKHFDDPIPGGLRFFANDPLVAPPGTKFNYSTHGYTLVGCAIEGASAKKYADYARENIFLPAGMTSTQADDRIAVIPHRTRFYEKTKAGAIVNANFIDSSYKIPGGGWILSPEDMARFEVAILADRLISRATRDIIWTPQKAADGSQNGYALGWGTGSNNGISRAGHSGSQQGASTAIILAPEQRDGVVVLVNLEDVNAFGLATELLRIVVGKPATDPKK